MVITPKKQLILFNLVMILVAVGIIALVVVPYVGSIGDMRQDIASTQETLEARRAHVVESRRSIQELPAVEESVKKYQEMTIRVGDELAVITTFERLAAEHGIEQQLLPSFVEQKGGKQQHPYPYYEFQFVNSGTYEQHVKYLRSLELLPYYVMIDSMQFERAKGKQGDSPDLITRFTARVYATP